MYYTVCVYIVVTVCIYTDTIFVNIRMYGVSWHGHPYGMTIAHHGHTMPWLVKYSYSIGLFAELSWTPREGHGSIRLAVVLDMMHARGKERVLSESLLLLLVMQRFGNVSVSDF